jgi:hypothetical protein
VKQFTLNARCPLGFVSAVRGALERSSVDQGRTSPVAGCTGWIDDSAKVGALETGALLKSSDTYVALILVDSTQWSH